MEEQSKGMKQFEVLLMITVTIESGVVPVTQAFVQAADEVASPLEPSDNAIKRRVASVKFLSAFVCGCSFPRG